MNNRQINYIQKDCLDILTNIDELAYLKNQQLYLTGAGGFMGSWLIEMINCLNCNFDFNVSVLATSRSWEFAKENTPHLFSYKNITFLEQDVRNPIEIPTDHQWIIHLASNPDNRIHTTNPLKIVETITHGTTNILHAASRLDHLKKFLNISSGNIYGGFQDTETDVKEDQFGPLNCSSILSTYQESKRMGETITQIFSSQTRIPVATLRPFAFIGPNQQLDRPWAINNFVRDALNGEKIRILGNTQTKRSYMYPSDMAYWILKYLGDSKSNSFMNLGSDEGISLEEIAQTVADNFSKSIPLDTSRNEFSNIKTNFVPNLELAKTKYKLNLTINFKEAIRKTVEWHRLED